MDSSPDILILGHLPDGLGTPPLGLHASAVVSIVKLLFQINVPERVADNAMALRIQSSDQGEVVWKSNAGETRGHVLWRNALSDECVKTRCEASLKIVRSKAVQT